MTDSANFNDGGSRQYPHVITTTVGASEFGTLSGSAAILDIADIPMNGIVIDVSLAPETLFNGGGNDTIDIGIKADLNGDGDVGDTVQGLAETDVDGLLVGTADNAGAVAASGGARGVWVGRVMPYGGKVTAQYTAAAAGATSGEVRVNITYVVSGKTDTIYG